MNQKLREYALHESNVAPLDGAIISRETTSNGMEFIRIIYEDHLIHSGWSNRNKDKTKKPKHTGGKKPYAILMLQELDKFIEENKDVKNIADIAGCILLLARYIDWNTGKLIHKRNKEPLRQEDLQKIWRFGRDKCQDAINILKDNGLLTYKSKAYFISDKLMTKGKPNK